MKHFMKVAILASLLPLGNAVAKVSPEEMLLITPKVSDVTNFLNASGVTVLFSESSPELQSLNLDVMFTSSGPTYVDREKGILIRGEAVKIDGMNVTSINSKFNTKIIEQIPSPISLKAPNERVKVAMFTDSTCSWCQRVHSDLEGYLNQGISIDFYFFPRAGLESETARQMSAVLALPEEARFDAMQGLFERRYPQGSGSADDLVSKHYFGGVSLGVNGTPSFFVEGQNIPGYLPPQELLQVALSMAKK